MKAVELYLTHLKLKGSDFVWGGLGDARVHVVPNTAEENLHTDHPFIRDLDHTRTLKM